MNSLYTEINKQKIVNLNEGLLSKLVNWFKNLYKTQEILKDDKNIKIDVNNIKGPDKPTTLKDIESNKEELKLINDPKVGFPITSMLIKNKNKYIIKEDENGNKTPYDPKIDRYFYVEGKNKFYIGIVMFDDTMKNDNNYVNMLNIEVIDNIDDQQNILKFINNSFETKMKKKSGFKGSQYITKHQTVKTILLKLGYKFENNKNILFKVFK